MDSKATTKIDPAQAAETLIDFFTQVGRAMNTPLYRVVLHRDGQGEAEFQSLNPTECLVLKWESPTELKSLVAGPADGANTQSVFRKKCTKCMLHERPATT